MCVKINVLFSIIRVMKVYCGTLVGAAGFINNGGMFQCETEAIQNTTVQTRK